MAQKSEIKIIVRLDDDKIPSSIEWTSDEGNEQYTEAKAFLLSIFEKNSQDTLKLDLWTKEMEIGEMDRFMYHTLKSLCDTYTKATNHAELGNEMMKFVEYFGSKVTGKSADDNKL
ncbi:MAG: gliding motility protein GldC [Saprospiraceae bacterium]